MSTNTDHQTTEELLKEAIAKERRRCIGLVLAAYGICQLSGQETTARILDGLATRLEHEDYQDTPLDTL